MDLNKFINSFDANVTSDDLKRDSEDGLVCRALNSVDVLVRSEKIPLPDMRIFFTALLQDWPAKLPEFERKSEIVWSEPSERQVLLHKLLCEAQRYVEELIVRESNS